MEYWSIDLNENHTCHSVISSDRWPTLRLINGEIEEWLVHRSLDRVAIMIFLFSIYRLICVIKKKMSCTWYSQSIMIVLIVHFKCNCQILFHTTIIEICEGVSLCTITSTTIWIHHYSMSILYSGTSRTSDFYGHQFIGTTPPKSVAEV